MRLHTISAATMLLLLVFVASSSMFSRAQTYSVIHDFTDGPDGAQPMAGLTLDRGGNLYGPTLNGGNPNCQEGYGCGVVFKLQHHGSRWLLTTMHSFTGVDGFFPMGRVLFGPDGRLYGTTNGTWGTVFSLAPLSHVCGSVQCPWTHHIVYAFAGGSDGGLPSGDLSFDQAGKIYGTTMKGGSDQGYSGFGVVYEISHGAESVL